VAPDAELSIPWHPAHSARAYVLTGRSSAGPDSQPVKEGQLVVVLLLGGLPIRAPIAFYGPFVMNTREEIQQALDDYLAGRLGVNPKILLSCRY
jgi:redox-sensitive bicupin YhaK (pirin superfamily)